MCRWPQVTARILMRRCWCAAGGIIAAPVIAKGCMQIAILHRPTVCSACYQQLRQGAFARWWSWWRVANAFGELNLFVRWFNLPIEPEWNWKLRQLSAALEREERVDCRCARAEFDQFALFVLTAEDQSWAGWYWENPDGVLDALFSIQHLSFNFSLTWAWWFYCLQLS